MRRRATALLPVQNTSPFAAGRGARLWFLLGLASCCLAGHLPKAAAWTETTVTGASADMRIEEDGTIDVLLSAQVRVSGGWLSVLDIDGLPEGLVLLADRPATFASEDGGVVLLPKAQVQRGGRVQLTFEKRRQAPRRGRYQLRLPYRYQAALQGAERPTQDRVRIPLALPAWESGIEGAELRVDAPAHSEAAQLDGQTEFGVTREQGRTLLTFRRSQLPRTVPFEVAVDVPLRALSAAQLSDEGPTLRSLKPLGTGRKQSPVFPWVVGGLSLLKLLVSALRARRAGLEQRYLLPCPSRALRGLAVVGLVALSQRGDLSPLALLLTGSVLPVSLVLERRAQRRPPRRPLRCRVAKPRELRALTLSALLSAFDASALLDLTTPAGALVAMALSLLGVLALQHSADPALLLTALLPALALFLSATRRAQPRSIGEHARRLLRAQHRLGSHQTSLVSYASRLGEVPTELRLRLSLAEPVPGLHQLDLVMGELRWLDRHVEVLCWLVIADRDSLAGQRAQLALPAGSVQHDDGQKKLAVLAPAQDLEQEAAALLGWLNLAATKTAQAA